MSILRSKNKYLQNSHGDVKYSIRKAVAKKLTYLAHGHEQGWQDCLRELGVLSGGEQRGKSQDNVIA